MLTVNQLTLTHRKDLTVLVDSLSFTLNDGERLALIGEEGNGKSTLLHLIRNTLEKRSDLRVFYMPQDAGDLLDFSLSPVELLSPSGKKEERSRAGILLGSMKFTADEMNHPSAGLSGGQKAKLMFLMMAESDANVLLLDEPTRNLSPLSGPVIRELLAEYPGCIITVSHDRRLIQEVCTRTVALTPEGCAHPRFATIFDRIRHEVGLTDSFLSILRFIMECKWRNLP